MEAAIDDHIVDVALAPPAVLAPVAPPAHQVVAAPAPVAWAVHRNRACVVCRMMFAESALLAHKRTCVAVSEITVNEGVLPIGACDGKDVFALISGMPLDYQQRLAILLQTVCKQGPQGSSRPAHRGQMIPFGWSTRYNRPHAGTEAFAMNILELYNKALELPIVRDFRLMMQHPHFVNRGLSPQSLPPAVAPGSKGNANAFVGINYSQQPRMGLLNHGPPPAVARIIGGQSCQDMCLVCRTVNCESCLDCVMHRDPDDSSLTLLTVFMPARATIRTQCAFLILNNVAYLARGGLCAIFNGREISHGVWAPPTRAGFGGHVFWHSCNFVVRS